MAFDRALVVVQAYRFDRHGGRAGVRGSTLTTPAPAAPATASTAAFAEHGLGRAGSRGFGTVRSGPARGVSLAFVFFVRVRFLRRFAALSLGRTVLALSPAAAASTAPPAASAAGSFAGQ